MESDIDLQNKILESQYNINVMNNKANSMFMLLTSFLMVKDRDKQVFTEQGRIDFYDFMSNMLQKDVDLSAMLSDLLNKKGEVDGEKES
jgi:hypothetical protein